MIKKILKTIKGFLSGLDLSIYAKNEPKKSREILPWRDDLTPESNSKH
jgi:hypothetical protein